LLKNLSADATVAGIVNNIVKLIQTFGNNSHGPQASDYCFEAFCRNTVVSFSCMVSKSSDFWVRPLILTHIRLEPVSVCGASLTISKMHSTL